jgi:hypothetical protein
MVEIDAPTQWLLEGPTWVAYRARLDLLRQAEENPQIVTARQAMLADLQVQMLVSELSGWPGSVLSSHKSAGHPLHKLVFLADLGLRVDDPGMGAVVERILEHRSAEGPFQVLTNVPRHFGGSGLDEWAWSLCDAPLLAYALSKLGLGDHPEVRAAVEYLAGLGRDNGWPCAVSKELGRFRGPGRKEDPCPYANLVMLKVLSQSPEGRDSAASRVGAETLLALWRDSAERHPYLFYMGTDFRKLKVPLIWYDILHVMDVLARFPWLRKDPRFQEMAEVVRAKADPQGRFAAESVWTAWRNWEFGQKREPSRWVTLVARRACCQTFVESTTKEATVDGTTENRRLCV